MGEYAEMMLDGTKEAGLWQHMRDKHGSGYGRVAE